VGFHCASNLHRRQHEATGRVDHEIDRNIFTGLLDRSNDRLGVLEIDVPRHCEAEQATPLPPMDHSDNTRTMRLFDRSDRLGASDGVPTPRHQRLQCDKREEYPKKR
jgi:hypothetical protein